MKDSKLFFNIKILSLCGIILAIFLLYEQLFHPTFEPCRINSTVNCDAVVSGVVSKTLGIPTPLYGLVGYIVIFFSTIFKKKKLLLGMALFGFLFCAWIAYMELIILRVICPVCIGCDVIILTTFILAIILIRNR